MGEESVDAVSLGTTLIIFACAVVFSLASVFIGKNWGTNFINNMDARESSSKNMSFQDLTGDGVNIPAAGAYAFLAYNDKFVETITCTYGLENCNKATEPDAGEEDKRAVDVYESCLQNHITGICNMQATYNEDTQCYDVTVSPAKDGLVN